LCFSFGLRAVWNERDLNAEMCHANVVRNV
jgi:hypothetical protein